MTNHAAVVGIFFEQLEPEHVLIETCHAFDVVSGNRAMADRIDSYRHDEGSLNKLLSFVRLFGHQTGTALAPF